MKMITTLFLAAALFGCASAENAPEPSAPDSITVPIKLTDTLEDYWVVNQKFPPYYPTWAVEWGHEGCATVGYFIEADGTTSRHWVISSYPKQVFERSALEASLKYSYTPGVHNKERQSVMTTYTFSYRLALDGFEPRVTEEAIVSRCKDAAMKIIKDKYGWVPPN